MNDVLGVLVLLGSGLVAGVFFAVALSVLPALFAMPPDRYVYAHKLLGRNWDPAMPIIVLTSFALTVVLAVRAPTTGTRWAFAAVAVLLILVSIVSHWCNVPINRRVKDLDPDQIPDDWVDPRPLWRRWHYLRTSLAVVALVVTAGAVTQL